MKRVVVLFNKTTTIHFNWLKLSSNLSRLVQGLKSDEVSNVKPIKGFLSKCQTIASTRGYFALVTYLKSAKLVLSKHLCGTPLKYTEGRIGIDKYGLPKVLPLSLRKLILKRNHLAIILSYTLLSISRIIPVMGSPKLSTITEPFTGSQDTVNEFVKFIETRFVPFTRRAFEVPTLEVPKLLPSLRSGPTGAPASLGVFLDIINLYVKNVDTEVRDNLSKWCEAIPGYSPFIEECQAMASQLTGKPILDFPTPVSRLHNLPDKEGKVRIIAIMDGVTQAVLYPLHCMVFAILKLIPNDFTHNQRSAVGYIVNRSQSLKNRQVTVLFHCFDLSAATDRLPLSVQAPIVGGLLGNASLGENWANLISKRNFTYGGSLIRYEVGQPMGAYSSFAMLALTHHAIIQYAWWLLGGGGWCRDYAIVGDDIVILTKPLALKYKEIMAGLGVPINSLKTFISDDFFEFCKRYVLSGHDVSPLPISLLLTGGTNNTVQFWKEVEARGIGFYLSVMPFKCRKIFEFPTASSTVGHTANWMIKYCSICPSVHRKSDAEVTRQFLENLILVKFHKGFNFKRYFLDINIENLSSKWSWVPELLKESGITLSFILDEKAKALQSRIQGLDSIRTAYLMLQNGLENKVWTYLDRGPSLEDFTILDFGTSDRSVTADYSSVVRDFEESMSTGLAEMHARRRDEW